MSHHTRAVWVWVCIGLVLCLASCGKKQPEYAQPASFIMDPGTGTYYVSNANIVEPVIKEGETPKREDDNGFITTLDKDLNIVKHKFIEGGRDGVELNDPKGMAILGDTLWIADLDTLRGFDKRTGKNTANVSLRALGAVRLDDVAAGPEGILYASDSLKNRVFQIDTAARNAASVLAEGADLNGPKSLCWSESAQRVYVACWDGGTILSITPDGDVETFVINPDKFEHLAGIDADASGVLYVSDYHKGAISRVAPDSTVRTIAERLGSPADISLDRQRDRLLIPLTAANEVTTRDLSGGD